MGKGTYVLSLGVDTSKQIEVGSLGEKVFEAGQYAYVGSAFGPGGLNARIARHKTVLNGDNTARHWHIDYLLPVASSLTVFVTESKVECETVASLDGRIVKGFGSSDCSCYGHLVRTTNIVEELPSTFRRVDKDKF